MSNTNKTTINFDVDYTDAANTIHSSSRIVTGVTAYATGFYFNTKLNPNGEDNLNLKSNKDCAAELREICGSQTTHKSAASFKSYARKHLRNGTMAQYVIDHQLEIESYL